MPNPTSYEPLRRRFPKHEKGKGRGAKTKLETVFLFKESTEEINVKGKKRHKIFKGFSFEMLLNPHTTQRN